MTSIDRVTAAYNARVAELEALEDEMKTRRITARWCAFCGARCDASKVREGKHAYFCSEAERAKWLQLNAAGKGCESLSNLLKF